MTYPRREWLSPLVVAMYGYVPSLPEPRWVLPETLPARRGTYREPSPWEAYLYHSGERPR